MKKYETNDAQRERAREKTSITWYIASARTQTRTYIQTHFHLHCQIMCVLYSF